MQAYKADLHIHTILSPCGSLEMSPVNIIDSALKKQLDIIAITDHNSTRQAPLIVEMAAEKGLFVIPGIEVNTSEEVHCLVLFENINQLSVFQCFIDKYIAKVKNKPDTFGEQIVVNREELIVYEEKYLLISALTLPLIDIEKKAHEIGGIVIPAHVDRPYYGIFSQLGFFPKELNVDAIELSKNANVEQWKASGKFNSNLSIVCNSDAHHPNQIGACYSVFEMESISFSEIRKALLGIDGRNVKPVNSQQQC